MIGKYDIPIGYYCVPSAIMALTGKPYEEVRKAINLSLNRRENAGIIRVSYNYIPDILKFLGHSVTDKIDFFKPLVLSQWEYSGAWLVRSSGHIMAIFDGEVCENQHVWWTPIKSSPSRMKRITNALKFN